MVVQVRLFGAVELRAGDRVPPLGPPKQRAVFAALAADAGRPVPIETLVGRVWGDAAPVEARNALYAHIMRIRRLLRDAGTQARLDRCAGGYVLRVDPDLVDIHLFLRLIHQARAAGADDHRRAALLREALGLWRGIPVAGLPGSWFARLRDVWRRHRLDAVVAWARAELRLGNHEEVLSRLREVSVDQPLVEPVAVTIMQALHAAGRGAEALDHYAAVRSRLADELGAEPGDELNRLHLAILRGEAAVAVPAARPVPAQLPAGLPHFAGRRRELTELDRLLAGPGTPVALISGTAGVGKTALAIHWAHRAAGAFADGQLYADLRGFEPQPAPAPPASPLPSFLAALGVPPERVPADPAEQAALYRSVLADRRVLVVLDNARTADQARTLLPGSAGCRAVVTSRDRLDGLAAMAGARCVDLDVLDPGESEDLLTARLGADRMTAEPQAAAVIVQACAGLPLALGIAATRAGRSGSGPARVAAELADAGRRLDALDTGDPASRPRSVFACSYDGLSVPARRLFRLLGLHPGPDIGVGAAASLAAASVPETRRMLAELTRSSLLTEHVAARYRTHDLLHAYAAELAGSDGSSGEREAARRRLLDHYLRTAYVCARRLMPGPPRMALPLPERGVTVGPCPSAADALAWFTAEATTLPAMIELARARRLPAYAWRLALLSGGAGAGHTQMLSCSR